MTVRNLEFLLKPSSVAVIGASEKATSVGAVIIRNLLGAGFKGEVFPVNPAYETIEGLRAYPDVAGLPKPPDLAVIATPARSVPGLIGELGNRGTKTAVVISAGFGNEGSDHERNLTRAVLEASRPHLLRIVGPNCLGIMVPGSHLNASISHIRPMKGNLALVAQSGAVQTAVLDWATSRRIGFSHLISLGDMADVDFGDVLDYLSSDMDTRAILLYMETITRIRKFMSAARIAARMKPVIVVKAGRHPEGAGAAARHTGAPAGNDAVYDAAFRRAGMLRVYDVQSLLDAVETLAMMPKPIAGDRLAIVTNGGGIGVITVDALMDRGGRLADLSPRTFDRLNQVLPPLWSRSNPIDIVSDAPASRYTDALEAVFSDKGVDAVLVLHCPNAIVSTIEAAQAVIGTFNKGAEGAKMPILLTSWLGNKAAVTARRLFEENRIPTYMTPTDAVRAFMHMVNYRRNQEMLIRTSPGVPEAFAPDTEKVQQIIEQVLSEERQWLTEIESEAVLTAYGIPVVPAYVTETRQETGTPAERIDGAQLSEFAVPPLMCRPPAHELFIGMTDDAQFGPVLLFGHGGPASDVIQDKVYSLPPLNLHLAEEMMSQTRIYRLLRGFRGMPAADIHGIALTLVKVSQLVCDIAEIAELEINPLLADERGVVSLSVRIKVTRTTLSAPQRLAIRPYPRELEETLTLADGRTLQIRPIRPEDEPGFQKIFESLSPEDKRMRFLHPMQTLTHEQAARLTQIDYDREMALVIAGQSASGESELYGSVCIITYTDRERAEYAILVRRDMAGKGLGRLLMERIIEYARTHGIKEIFGEVLSENKAMLHLCDKLGFAKKRDPDNFGVVTVSLRLDSDERGEPYKKPSKFN